MRLEDQVEATSVSDDDLLNVGEAKAEGVAEGKGAPKKPRWFAVGHVVAEAATQAELKKMIADLPADTVVGVINGNFRQTKMSF